MALAIFANYGRLDSCFDGRKVDTSVPTRNVNLTKELDNFVLTRVESGRFENASEVVRAALRTLEREERLYEAKLEALRAAIDEGDASGVAEGDVFAQVREALHLGVNPS
jgi:antitoxin ParD1/3/4